MKNKLVYAILTKHNRIGGRIMSIERVKAYFEKFGMADRIRELEISSATVELAAAAIGCEAARIAKSITFKLGDEAILIVAAGDGKIDNAKYKAQFGAKAKMLTPDEVETLIGHSIGGVCPFGINEGVKVYLDCSLKRFESVYPACGSSNSVMELSVEELEKYSGSVAWVDVCKNWEQ